MNKKLTGLALFLMCSLLLVPAAMADSACPLGDTMAQYLSLYGLGTGVGCTIGNLDFSNFQFGTTSDPGGTAPGSGSVNVNTTNIAPNENGFDFTGGWNGENTQDVNIKFDVTAAPGTYIDDIFIGLSGESGAGSINYTEDFCANGTKKNPCDTFVDYPKTNTTTDILLSNTALGGPVTSLSITKDVQITEAGGTADKGSKDGQPYLSDIINAYSTVPEPRDIPIVLGMALLVALVIKRRLANQA